MCLMLRNIREDDCDLLFKWVNDSEVREMAFNTNAVLYEDHKKWFYNKLNSKLTHIFIACVDGKPIGQIRIDLENDEGIICYSIDSNFRGQGYGSKVLKEIIKIVTDSDINVSKLIGKVKHNNIKSCKAFENAGYKRIERKDYIEYYMEI